MVLLVLTSCCSALYESTHPTLVSECFHESLSNLNCVSLFVLLIVVSFYSAADCSVGISSVASNVVTMSSLSSIMSPQTSQPLSQLAARLSQGPQRPPSPHQLRNLLQRPQTSGGQGLLTSFGGQETSVTQMGSGTPISTTKVWVPGIP